MIVKEIQSKTILSNSKIYDYVVNPYVGCQHACSYCYARFMKRFTGHKEAWGEFVDAKVNAPELLQKEILKKKRATVWVSGVCDPYQPLEKKYELTRRCLEILVEHDWPIVIQTRSPLILRDLEILRRGQHLEAGFSVTTAEDEVRKIFEPHAPPIPRRIQALAELHGAGIKTFAMIAPMLPGAEALPELLAGKVDHILVDRMNYDNANWVYQQHGLQAKHTDEYFESLSRQIASDCQRLGIECRIVF
jgi:DNA repair photolyase